MILIIIAGHIDLSAGSVVARHRRDLRGADGQPGRALAARHAHHAGRRARLIGAWQGYWIAYFGIPAFIVTLAGMLVFRALTLTVLGNQGIGPFPDAGAHAVQRLPSRATSATSASARSAAPTCSRCWSAWSAVAGIVVSQWRARGGPLGYGQKVESLHAVRPEARRGVRRGDGRPGPAGPVQEPAVGAGAAGGRWCSATRCSTNRTVFGRHIYAVGGNLQAATLSGVKVKRSPSGSSSTWACWPRSPASSSPAG